MCAYSYIACVYICVHACGGQRLSLCLFFNHTEPYFLRQGLSLNQEFTGSARLAGQQAPGVFSLSAVQLQEYHHSAWFFTQAVEIELSPCVCMAILY